MINLINKRLFYRQCRHRIFTIIKIILLTLIIFSCERKWDNPYDELGDGIQPLADFTVSQTSVIAGNSVQFTDQSINTPTSWSWDFGDGGTSTSQNPLHAYSTAGTYTVELTATNDFGSDTETKNNYITVNLPGSAPVANFSANITSITEGETVNFTDLSTNIPTNWSWNFGDGGTSNSQNPSHTYSTAGTYTVTLTATNNFGSDNETKTNYITVINENESVTDYDGNIYQTVQIGNQIWMAENLKTTHYNDGTAIQNVTDNTAWRYLTTGAYCWYNNDETTYKNIYGALYNWYTVNTEKLCPTGWHVPSDAEWKTLEMTLGMSQSEADDDGWRGTDEGGKMKETGTAHWNSPNTGATNTSGFTALPGGFRGYGSFSSLGHYGYWWSSTEHSGTNSWGRFLSNQIAPVDREYTDKTSGFSVRCLKD